MTPTDERRALEDAMPDVIWAGPDNDKESQEDLFAARICEEALAQHTDGGTG